MDLRGKFIVLDGPDGGGKGTQLEALQRVVEAGGGTWTYAKDPGGSVIGDRIRRILLSDDLKRMHPRCETLLFMASRAQLVGEVIRPALERGETVLGDRFISATCAYQVAAGFPREDVIALGKLAVGETWPDLTVILDVPVEVGIERTGRGKRPRKSADSADQLALFDDARVDAMEQRSLEFHRRVRAIFQELPTFYPTPVAVLDATQSPEAVTQQVMEALDRAFG